MASNLKINRALRFRIDSEGKLKGRASPLLPEYLIEPEVLALLQGIQKGTPVHALEKNIRTLLTEALQHTPQTRELETYLTEFKKAGFFADAAIENEEGFGDPWIQWAMLADNIRLNAYQKALKQSVSKGMHVVDLGAGTGILGAIALHYGAGKVYGIEESSIAQKIPSILKTLKMPVKDYHVIQKNLENIPEIPRVQLVVSELFGNDPFQEGLLITLKQARKLWPKAFYIPEEIELIFSLVDLERGELFQRVSAFQENSEPGSFIELYKKSCKQNLNFNNLSFEYAINQSDFSLISNHTSNKISLKKNINEIKEKSRLKITRNVNNPVLIYGYRVYLNESTTMSSVPGAPDQATHWKQICIPLNRQLKKNDTLDLTYELEELCFTKIKLTLAGALLGSR